MPEVRIHAFETFAGEAQTLLLVTQRILDAMYAGDSEAYAALVAEDVSSFEPYIAPYRIDGLPFHLDLIASGGNGNVSRLDLLTPRVQVYGNAGVVTYTLLKTTLSLDEPPVFQSMNEARVFAKIDGNWKMVHLHKSPAA
ncbi:MAG TPA: nuclear transport factor 2 family protein [Capsulimonadaceae bacterium]|nr:nuclear transport factor 2 family protein [Capsulimonadaceae bacterium]